MDGSGPVAERRSRSARNSRGMVTAATVPAAAAGARMLQLGGNAVDAAVAAAFCLGVTEPQASGLGGQTMALLHLGKTQKSVAVDGSSRAPFAIDPMRLPGKPRTIGLKSATVPSTPAALGYLHQHYGRLGLGEVLQPSIRAAREGFEVTALLHRLIRREQGKLLGDPRAARRFFRAGKPLAAGERLVQPELADCLQYLARDGWEAFYHGRVGRAILDDARERGGLLTRADLSQIPLPRERPVLEGRYRNHRLATFPPPGAGRALVEILNILETFDPGELELSDPRTYVILAHVFQNALRDRDQRPVDPDLYQQTKKKRMTDKRHAERISDRIRRIIPPRGETTHLCAADTEGNVVGITQSIELVFGSKRVNPEYGFFYNNYMNTFEYRDMAHPYYLLPGAEPWSSVAPTILLSKRSPVMVLGSPGSERIATSLAQVIFRVVDAGEPLDRAVAAPRLHAGKAGRIQIEKKRFDSRVLAALGEAGFSIKRRGAYSFYLGCVQAIQLPRTGRDEFFGVADPRRDGDARGPGQPEVERTP
jgi:gamma-glutamyltranspeptidase/glutathione hydrolase